MHPSLVAPIDSLLRAHHPDVRTSATIACDLITWPGVRITVVDV